MIVYFLVKIVLKGIEKMAPRFRIKLATIVVERKK